MAFIGVASAAVERREASPLRVLLKVSGENSEGAAAPAGAVFRNARLPALRLPLVESLLTTGVAKLGRAGAAGMSAIVCCPSS